MLEEELSSCPLWVLLPLSHPSVLPWFPVLVGQAAASSAVLGNSHTFISRWFLMEMPNATVVCQAYPTSALA